MVTVGAHSWPIPHTHTIDTAKRVHTEVLGREQRAILLLLLLLMHPRQTEMSCACDQSLLRDWQEEHPIHSPIKLSLFDQEYSLLQLDRLIPFEYGTRDGRTQPTTSDDEVSSNLCPQLATGLMDIGQCSEYCLDTYTDGNPELVADTQDTIRIRSRSAKSLRGTSTHGSNTHKLVLGATRDSLHCTHSRCFL